MSKKVKGQKLTLGAALDKFGGSEDPIPSGPSRGGDRWERGRDPEQDRSWNRRDRDDDFGDRPRRFRDDDGPSRADESSAWRREGGSRPTGRSEFSSRSDRYSRPFDDRRRYGGDSEGRGRFGDSPERRWRDGGKDDYPPRRRYDDRDRDDRPRYNDRPRYSDRGDRGRESYSRSRDDDEERPAHLRRGIKKSSEESGLTSDDFPDPSASRPKEKSVSPSRKPKPTPKPARKESEDDPFGGAKPVGPGKLEPVRGGQLKRGSSPGASSRSPPVASRRGRDDDREERGRGNTTRRSDDRRSAERDRREDSDDRGRGDSRKSSPRRGGPRGRGKDSEGSEGEEESPKNKKPVNSKSEKKQPSLAKLIREKSAVTVDQLTGSLSQLNINREGKDLSVSLSKSLLNGKVTIKSLLEILEKEKLDAKDQSEIVVNTLKLVKKNKDASFVEDLIAKSSSNADVVAVIAQAVISPPKKGKKVDKEEEKKKIAEHLKNQDLEFLVSEEEKEGEEGEEEEKEEKEENDEEDAENDDEDGGKEEDDELDPEEDILSHKAKYVPKSKQQQPVPAKPVSKEKEKHTSASSSASSKTSSKPSQPPKEDTSSRKTKKDVEALFPGRATVSSVKAAQEEEDKKNKKNNNVVSDKIVKEVKTALTNKTPSEVSTIVKEATGDLTPLLDPIAHALYQQLLTKPTPQQLAALAEREKAEKAAEKAKQKAKEKKEQEKDKTKGKGKEQEKEKVKKKVQVKEEEDEEEGDNGEEADEEEDEDEKPKKKSKDEEEDEEDDEENDKKKKGKKDAKEATKKKGDKDVPAASSTSTGGPNISIISDWRGLLKLVLTGVEAEHNFLTSLQNSWFESVQKNDTLKAYIKPIFEELFKQRMITVPALVAWKEKADKSKAKVQTLIKVNTWLTAVTEPVKESEEADEEEADEEEEDAYLQNPNKEFLT